MDRHHVCRLLADERATLDDFIVHVLDDLAPERQRLRLSLSKRDATCLPFSALPACSRRSHRDLDDEAMVTTKRSYTGVSAEREREEHVSSPTSNFAAVFVDVPASAAICTSVLPARMRAARRGNLSVEFIGHTSAKLLREGYCPGRSTQLS